MDDLLSLPQSVRQQTQTATLDARQRFCFSEPSLIGCSETFIKAMKQVGRVAGTNVPVMLTGESGTGKEVVALALHRRSLRAHKPFISVNRAAIPADLIESELFGHERGSSIGSDGVNVGLWEKANGGTVFLEEVTETPLVFQVKLLRALEQGEIRRVGSSRTICVDVRVIATSNRCLEQEVKAGRFREDLYYRLNVISIALPPLRERREDISLLAQHFARLSGGRNMDVLFTPEALKALESYSWPENIRELKNAVVQATAMCDEVIHLKDLPERVRSYKETLQIAD
jgi:DNA-binding NtrC family response regulator